MGITLCLFLCAAFLIMSVTSNGFILDQLTMDARTYEACSTCDGRSDRTGSRVIAAALRSYMTKNHIKTVVESGDVKIVERLPNTGVDTGRRCRPAELTDGTLTAEMVNPNNELDSMSIDYEEMMKMAFMTGEVPHRVTFRATFRVKTYILGLFGGCGISTGRKSCRTSSTSMGTNKILVTLSASEVQTFELGGQHHLEFKLGVQVQDILESKTYAPMSVPREKCDLRFLGMKVGSVSSQVQKGANDYLRKNNHKINELRGSRLIKRLEDVLKAKLGDVVKVKVNVTGGKGRKLRTSNRSAKKCQKRKCPSGFYRIGNTQLCQKTFGLTKPNCSMYSKSATMTTRPIAGGRYTVYSCIVDMVPAK